MKLDFEILKIPSTRDYWTVVKKQLFTIRSNSLRRRTARLVIDNQKFELVVWASGKKTKVLLVDWPRYEGELRDALKEFIITNSGWQIWIITTFKLRTFHWWIYSDLPKEVNFVHLSWKTLSVKPLIFYDKPKIEFHRQNLVDEIAKSKLLRSKPNRKRLVDDEGLIMNALSRGEGDRFGF